jgi:hypothetical protein
MSMREKKVRQPDAWWRAVELLAEALGTPESEIARTGIQAYVCYCVFRLGAGAPAVLTEHMQQMAEVQEGFDELFAASAKLARVWPL